MLIIMARNSNVFSDLSGIDYYTRMMPYPTSVQEMARQFIEKIGADRILFGSDNNFAYAETVLDTLERLGISQDDKEKIMYRNIERILKL